MRGRFPRKGKQKSAKSKFDKEKRQTAQYTHITRGASLFLAFFSFPDISIALYKACSSVPPSHRRVGGARQLPHPWLRDLCCYLFSFVTCANMLKRNRLSRMEMKGSRELSIKRKAEETESDNIRLTVRSLGALKT